MGSGALRGSRLTAMEKSGLYAKRAIRGDPEGAANHSLNLRDRLGLTTDKRQRGMLARKAA